MRSDARLANSQCKTVLKSAKQRNMRCRCQDGETNDEDDLDDLGDLDDLTTSFAKIRQRRKGLDAFSEEMQKADEDIDLAKCALLIAQHRYPEIDVEDYLRKLDLMAQELLEFLPPADERYPLRVIRSINSYLYDTRTFSGNFDNYYDADNSCLNRVLDTGLGIPITLSLVYMELARRVSFPMVGVNLPAHFMIRPLAENVEILVDCYNKGETLFVEDAEKLLAPYYGLEDASQLKIDRSFLNDHTLHPRTFLTRMLTNLKQIYFDTKEYDLALTIALYQQESSPDDNVRNLNIRDIGILYYLQQRFPEAVMELETYLQAMPEADDAPQISKIVDSIKSWRISLVESDDKLNDESDQSTDIDSDSSGGPPSTKS